jgi:hypothetical protein
MGDESKPSAVLMQRSTRLDQGSASGNALYPIDFFRLNYIRMT